MKCVLAVSAGGSSLDPTAGPDRAIWATCYQWPSSWPECAILTRQAGLERTWSGNKQEYAGLRSFLQSPVKTVASDLRDFQSDMMFHNMDEAQELKSIDDIIRPAVKPAQGDFLYRGHRTVVDEPTPKVFRPNDIKGINCSRIRCGLEPMLGHEFRDYAHSVRLHCPPVESWFEWLALMQHHGAPTRLLDWTRNILVAAFFATESGFDKDDNNDGEILTLDSSLLTQIARHAHEENAGSLNCHCADNPSNNGGSPFSVTRAAKRLAEQAFADFRSRGKKTCRVCDTCRFPQAVAPPRTFSRLVTQRAWFTIHPTPAEHEWAKPADENPRESEATLPLSEILGRDEMPVLTRHIIPSQSKKAIRDSLGALCITRATLFADLDGLALSLISELQRRFPE